MKNLLLMMGGYFEENAVVLANCTVAPGVF